MSESSRKNVLDLACGVTHRGLVIARGVGMGVIEKIKPATKSKLKPAIKLPRNQILRMDCIEAMRSLPDCSIDMVFADPP